MKISRIIWPEDRVDHIARHGVTPDEFEEVCLGDSLLLRTWSMGENPVYNVLGQTLAGMHLFCVVIGFTDGNGFPVTARPMNVAERRRFKKWKQK